MKRLLTFLSVFFLLQCAITHVSAQTRRTITGVVTDKKSGETAIGVFVSIKGTNIGTQTGVDGDFSITGPAGPITLIFRQVGYKNIELPVDEMTANVTVAMEEDVKQLDQLVVTAIGLEREKRTLTYTTQQIKGDMVVQAKEANIVNGIAGKVAGVQVTNSSGMPGSSSRIVIRGNTSLTGNNQPLFVIDGIPIDNSQVYAGTDDPVLAGGTTNRGIDIDPNIVESMTVLKGASATALYGSRAAGGAIIITTKSGNGLAALGKKKGPTISFTSNFALDYARLPEFQDKYSLGVGGIYNDGETQQNSSNWGANLDTMPQIKRYDPRKQFFQTGVTYDNSVNLSGFTDKSSYFLSYSNLNQTGIVPGTKYVRNSFFGKFSNTLSEKMTATVNINYVNSDNDRFPEGNGTQSYLWTVYGAPLNYDLEPSTNPDGTQRLFRTGRNNPFWLVDNTGLNMKVDRFIPYATLSYDVLPWLNIMERGGLDMYTDRRKYFEAQGIVSPYPDGRVYDEVINNMQFNNDLIVTAKKAFNEDWNGSILIGNNVLTESMSSYYTQGQGLSIPNFYNIANASVITSENDLIRRRRVSMYGQAIVEYKRMLSLTITGRNDWVSTLPVNNRSFFYPSFSAGFVFTDPLGLTDSRILNYGKLRAAYTIIGNDAPAQSLTTQFTKISVGDGQRGQIAFPFNGQNGFTLNNVAGNPNLKPERISEFEIGTELQFFQNRINLDVVYYNKVSKDLIFTAPVAGSTGFVQAIINAGEMRNNGVEVVLNATAIKTENFTWDIGINWARNRNKVIDLGNGIDQISYAGFTDPGIYFIKGQPYGAIFGTRFQRDANGKILVDDDGYPIAVDPQLGVIGNTTPDWIGGITNTFSYKNWGFNFLFDVRKGGDIMNLDNNYLAFYGTPKYTEDRETATMVIDGVRASDGGKNTTPIKKDEYYYRNIYIAAEENWVEDGTYIRLRQVGLTYRFGKSQLKRSPFQEIVLGATARNIFLYKPNFTGSDPEVSLYGSANAQGFYSFITPATKSINFSVRVIF